MDIQSWFQLAAICFLGAISPGPSLAFIASNTILRGRVYGVLTGFGHGTGIGLWAFLTATGIAKVIMGKSASVVALQSLGACVIGYIGFRTIMVRDWTLGQRKDARSTSSDTLLRGIGEGFLISLFNPKIALFFLAIFSHFVHSDSNLTEIVLMGITAALIDALWYISVALMLTGSDIGRILEDRAKAISLISGIFLIVIALYLIAGSIQRAL